MITHRSPFGKTLIAKQRNNSHKKQSFRKSEFDKSKEMGYNSICCIFNVSKKMKEVRIIEFENRKEPARV